ncbi:MAG: epoxyqueuosine reductase QueH [Oscillospiraceae bacterium]|nr:epoxyqueuosine reductase QueH [Oscillospiraceae bacterium]
MSAKINYQKILESELKKIGNSTPKLLLHSCCAPCSSYVLEYLTEYFEIILYYYNPNIYPEKEYNYRLEELKRLINAMPLKNKIYITPSEYNPDCFMKLSEGLEELPERGLRCQKCIMQRLKKTAEKAVELNADYFTTTLTISPYKDSEYINKAGSELEKEYKIKYLFSDFKKREGYKRSIQLSEQYNLYRQNFCGCIYSKKIAEAQKSV